MLMILGVGIYQKVWLLMHMMLGVAFGIAGKCD